MHPDDALSANAISELVVLYCQLFVVKLFTGILLKQFFAFQKEMKIVFMLYISMFIKMSMKRIDTIYYINIHIFCKLS